MASRLRHGFTAVQRTEMWERWRQGERVSDIARALEIPYMSINYALRRHGGFSPPQRRRAAHCLTLAEREEISRGLVLGWSGREIARQLGREPSTISREVQRVNQNYCAVVKHNRVDGQFITPDELHTRLIKL